MLKITRKVEYALIALRHFQNQEKDKLTSGTNTCIPADLASSINLTTLSVSLISDDKFEE